MFFLEKLSHISRYQVDFSNPNSY